MNIKEVYIADLVLEKYLAGELDKPQEERLKKQIEGSADLQGRIKQMKDSNDYFFQKYSLQNFEAAIQDKGGVLQGQSFAKADKTTDGSGSAWLPSWFADWLRLLKLDFNTLAPLAALASAALLVGVLFLNKEGFLQEQNQVVQKGAPPSTTSLLGIEGGDTRGDTQGDTQGKIEGNAEEDFQIAMIPNSEVSQDSLTESHDIILKGGGAKLYLFKKVDGAPALLQDGDSAQEGDELYLSYSAGKLKYGVIFSIDGAGAVTLHYPYQPNGSNALESGKNIDLQFGYKLDDAPAFERFYFISSENKLHTGEILELAEQAAADQNRVLQGSLEVEPGRQLQTILLLKK